MNGMQVFRDKFRPKNVTKLAAKLLTTVVFASAGSPAAHELSPAPIASPNLDLHLAGFVLVSKVLSDGSLIIGGQFNSLDGVPRSALAKFKPNGDLDPNWKPSIAGGYMLVTALDVDSSGDIYVGGSFTSVDGIARSNIAKLLPDGSLDSTWNPSPGTGDSSTPSVDSIALDNNGNLIVAGLFSTIGGASLSNLAKISATGAGTADSTWSPNPDGEVGVLAYSASGDLFVCGPFTNVAGIARNHIAKISVSDGSVDPTWNPAPSGGSATISALALDGSGNIYVGGEFTSIGGQSRTDLARLSTTGAGLADSSWSAPVTGTSAAVESLALDGAGKIYVGGYFDTIAGQSLNNLARVSTIDTGTADGSWNPNPDFYVYSITSESSGVIDAGGTFLHVDGALHLGFAKIDSTGAASNSTPDAETPGKVYAIAALPDGSTIIGGFFLKADGMTRYNLLRLNPDGTVDPNWDPAPDQFVSALATDGNGSVFVGGIFSKIDGQNYPNLAKISVDGIGSLDSTWAPGANNWVQALAVDSTGENIFVGGSFSSIGGQARTGLAKLSTTGSGLADTNWNPLVGGGGYVYTLALDGSGNLYAGGYFDYFVSSVERLFVGKFSTSGGGTPDANWDPQPDSTVETVALDGSGSNLYMGGRFTHIGATARNYLGEVSTTDTGTVNSDWNPNPDGGVYALLPIGSDEMYVGGLFSTIGGLDRSYIARVSTAGSGATDPDWDAGADARVGVLATDGFGKIVVGGDFTSIGTEPRAGVAAFIDDVLFSNGFDGP